MVSMKDGSSGTAHLLARAGAYEEEAKEQAKFVGYTGARGGVAGSCVCWIFGEDCEALAVQLGRR